MSSARPSSRRTPRCAASRSSTCGEGTSILEKVWDVESTAGKGVLYVSHSKNETSKRRMLEHYSHQRLKAKGQMLTRMEERKKESA